MLRGDFRKGIFSNGGHRRLLQSARHSGAMDQRHQWARLSCRTFAANAVRPRAPCPRLESWQPHADAGDAQDGEAWSMTSLREEVIKIGAKVVSHGRYVTCQMAEVGAPRRREEEIWECRSLLSSLAAQEMRAGPSGSDCRIRVQTATSRSRITSGVVSVDGKGGWEPVRCVSGRRT